MSLFKIFLPNKPDSHEDVYGSDNDALKKARRLVKKCMKPFDGGGIAHDSDRHVQLVVAGTSPLMLGVAFHAMQVCHFPNFDDKCAANRTKITIIAPGMQTREQVEDVKAQLSSTFRCLPQACACSLRVEGTDIEQHSSPKKCFIDIEIEVIGIAGGQVADFLSAYVPDTDAVASLVAPSELLTQAEADRLADRYWQVCIVDEDEDVADDQLTVDVRRGRLVNLIYSQSQHLRSITANHIHEVHGYAIALDKVAKDFSTTKVDKKWQELTTEYKLSNIYCADCFEYRLRSLNLSEDAPKAAVLETVERNIADMARTEHARWNVERLLLGFRPLNADEHHHYGKLAGQALSDYRAELKAQKAHVDICSYTDLMRIDMDSIKYDIFLMLTIPAIIARCPRK